MLKLSTVGQLAQSAERYDHTVEARGSNPLLPTKNLMELVKLLLILSLLSIIPGQLIRLEVLQLASLTISDIIVAITVLVGFVHLLLVEKTLRIDSKIVVPFTIFSLLAAASTILALNNFTVNEVAQSSLFLIRFMLYFCISVIAANVIKKTQIPNWVNLFLTTAVIFVLVGFAQLLFFPDLTFLAQYGWDPHQMRIAASFLDPNYSGGFLTMALAFALSFFLQNSKKIYLASALVIFLGIILTFSRSSYLAAAAVLFVIGTLKSPKLLMIFLAFSIFAYMFISQVDQRVKGAMALDDTARARIQSWKNAISIFSKNAFFGVGFNTYRYAQVEQGIFSLDDPLGGHSGAGSDSSILLVAATTGLFGLITFLLLLITIFKAATYNIRKSPLHLAATSIFIALLVHSQFVNSLFFPQIMLAFWFTVGLISTNDS